MKPVVQKDGYTGTPPKKGQNYNWNHVPHHQEICKENLVIYHEFKDEKDRARSTPSTIW